MSDVIEKALAKHGLIKSSMQDAIRNDLRMNPTDLRSDQTCAFGQWIYGQDSRLHKELPEFRAMKSSHRHFHEAAYHAMCMCRTGRREEAERSILTGDFETASLKFRQSLLALKQAIRT